MCVQIMKINSVLSSSVILINIGPDKSNNNNKSLLTKIDINKEMILKTFKIHKKWLIKINKNPRVFYDNRSINKR